MSGDEEAVSKSSERIRSWIQDRSFTHPTLDHDLPLTPPIISISQEDESWMDDPALVDYIPATDHISKDSEMVTPLIQRSPPTPETTPPRVQGGIRALAPPSATRDPSADSFETARETFSFEDDDPQASSPSLHHAHQQWLKRLGNVKPRDVGLGLGLEDQDENQTPTEMTPKLSLKTYDTRTCDDLQGKSRSEDVCFESDREDRTMIDRTKIFQPRSRVSTYPSMRPPGIGEDTGSGVIRSFSLRQRIEKTKHNPSSSIEKFAEEIDWPLKEEDLIINNKLRDAENRRLSQVSATSTIVEAMVIDTTPQRRKTLRHTSKTVDLKSGSPQANQSNRSSVISNNAHRRLPRNSKSPDGGKRKSVGTDASGSGVSSLAKVQQDVIPVIVIPERRSSLKSGALTRTRNSRTILLTSSRQQSLRPATAPEDAVGYFDLPHRERRTISSAVPASSLSKTEMNSVKGNSPPAIPRPSNSVAPAEQEPLGISSTNSASIDVVSPLGQPQAVVHLSDPSEIHGISLDRSRSGEWSALRPRSALVTPFSLRSAHSSTPGTLEVNEATAISIYPHTNQSILVIQQMAKGDSKDTPGHSAIIAGNANIALPNSMAPTIMSRSRQPLNSPLKNPRDPPQPPDFKIIPPTPSNVPPTPEIDTQQSPSARNRLSGSMTIVKRALSARRYSESFVSPLARSLSRRNTTPARRPSVGDDPDNKLHPFWRPRGFWDDLSDSDSDSEFGNSGVLVGTSSSPDLPRPRRNSRSAQSPFRGLSRSPSLTRRFTHSFRLYRNRRHMRSQSEDFHRLDKKKSSGSLNQKYQFVQSEHRHHENRPKMGYGVHFAGLKNLAARMENAKIKREEGKREKVREKLRGSIGVPRLGEGGLISGGMGDIRR